MLPPHATRGMRIAPFPSPSIRTAVCMSYIYISDQCPLSQPTFKGKKLNKLSNPTDVSLCPLHIQPYRISTVTPLPCISRGLAVTVPRLGYLHGFMPQNIEFKLA